MLSLRKVKPLMKNDYCKIKRCTSTKLFWVEELGANLCLTHLRKYEKMKAKQKDNK